MRWRTNHVRRESKALELPGSEMEIRRLRLERWRIVYAVTEASETVDVLAVRKRPLYDDVDRESLLKDFPPG
jgi:mRNA interferase RelE/StbE